MKTIILAALLLTTQALAAGPFDGLYTGQRVWDGKNAKRKCDQNAPLQVRVVDGTFAWRVGGDSTRVQVGPDGAFTGQAGLRFITGQIADGKLTARATGQYCDYAWSAAR